MSCDSGEIRYTLDGSDPGEDSLLYTAPLLIDDASKNENVYSARTDVSLDLNPEVLAAEGLKPLYGIKVPSQPVDKATVLRAVCIDSFGKRSEVQNAVYFVGFDAKVAYAGINIITITTDPDGLFDYENGIYVLGKRFDEMPRESLDKTTRENYRFWPANYLNRGRLWEREAHICFFDRDRKLTVEGDFGIRIQGSGGRGLMPKGLNIYAREKYGTAFVSGEKLFGLSWDLNRLNLNSGNDDMDTLLKDCIVNTLAGEMTFDTRPCEPYALFLDGEYWGMYWLTPRYKEDYFQGEYGLSGDEMMMVKSNSKEMTAEIGDSSDARAYQELIDTVAQRDMRDPGEYAWLCRQIDIDSYIDYYAVEMYIANTDWPNNNVAAWRTRQAGEGPCADGKWRWLLYDVNMSMDLRHVRTNYIQRTAGRDPMFCSLIANGEFLDRVRAKLVELAQDTFHPSKVSAFIKAYEQRMGKAMEYNFVRFRGGERTLKDFLDDCQSVNAFFEGRHAYIMEAYGE
ncbi:MAG: CotH kinase family protein [Clostridia bacterium]|nr:CotH kinase family protein [Clostridia bacterium]